MLVEVTLVGHPDIIVHFLFYPGPFQVNFLLTFCLQQHKKKKKKHNLCPSFTPQDKNELLSQRKIPSYFNEKNRTVSNGDN